MKERVKGFKTEYSAIARHNRPKFSGAAAE
jgi:hypothetical protein